VAENEKDKEDEFAANDLNQAVSAEPGCFPMNGRFPMVGLVRPASSSYAKELLEHNHLTFDPAMHDEGYVIATDVHGNLFVVAETAAGLFYGAQTVKQLIRGSGKSGVLLAPTLRDWPAMAHRGYPMTGPEGRCPIWIF